MLELNMYEYLLVFLQELEKLIPPPANCHHAITAGKFGSDEDGWKDVLIVQINNGGEFLQVFVEPDDLTMAPQYLADAVSKVHRPSNSARQRGIGLGQYVASFDFHAHLQRQMDWSERTFGPGARTGGVIDHIRKELSEIEADPTDISEWIDVAILALDGAWRAGYSPEQIINGLIAKQEKNEGRAWPDWRTVPTDKAIEHDRSKE